MLLAGLAGAAVGTAGSASRPTVLAILNGRLGRFDAVTLKPLGRTVDVGHSTFGFARSPSGTELAIVAARPAVLRIVDLRRLKTLVKLPLSSYPADAVTWVAPRAVLVEFGGLVVYRVDPVKRYIRETFLPDAGAFDLRSTPDGFVFLVPPAYDEIGAATLTTIDATGQLRSVLLDRISVGFHQLDPNASEFEQQYPGLAVDPLTDRAYVVGADRTVAEVDLKTLAVTFHAGNRTLAKSWTGSVRYAEWLGNGLIAVAGEEGAGQDASTPAGLQIVDTTTWTWRQLDPQARFAGVDGDALVVYDQQVGPTRTVSVYDLVGNVRFRVSGDLFDLQVARRTAYSLVPAGKTWGIDVLDAGSGRLLHRVKVSGFTLIAG